MKKLLRVHGDNIVECERTVKMIAEAFDTTYTLLECPLYFPKYSINTPSCYFEIELLSGHGRWSNIDLGDIIHKSGGKLRESADSYITEIEGNTEKVLLAIEYCSALPAGNNAWQRNGRALASVLANIPYLYYAEIGGIELDENRMPKAPRYPNPAVPFSYVSLSYDMDSVCLPIYQAHPSMTQANSKVYSSALGYKEGLQYIKMLLTKQSTTKIKNTLMDKAIHMTQILSNNRRIIDTLRANQWMELMKTENRVHWLASFDEFAWKKKSAGKVLVSNTYPLLKSKIESLGAKPITSKDLPFCVVPKEKLSELKKWIASTYNGLKANFSTNSDLAIVWITGFKPKGDDSRPDRGLSPLCRMILGRKANIMAIVYGPAKPSTWQQLLTNQVALRQSNGLFQAIYECCNYLFVDSATCDNYYFAETGASLKKNKEAITFKYISKPIVKYFEHDTDCAIHQIMSAKESMGIFECFCNPPGGDWSGITYFNGKSEYKWTSLPRVSVLSKRPDHIIQINLPNITYFVAIESKGFGCDLENNIGNRLKGYINDLFKSEPTAYRINKDSAWRFFNKTLSKINYKLITVGAFLFKDITELKIHRTNGNLDAVFAFEFDEISTLHISCNSKGAFLTELLQKIASEQGTFIIKVH